MDAISRARRCALRYSTELRRAARPSSTRATPCAVACQRTDWGALIRAPGAQRVDIDGGGAVEVDRDPITGPVGVLLCGGGGGALVVGFGADVGCGRFGADPFEVDRAGEDGPESLIAPPLGRSPGEEACEPWANGAPLGRSAPPAPLLLDETTAFFVSCPGG